VADPSRETSDLRVADLLTFLAVVRSSSLTAAARERKVTPSQVSKAITRVESHFGRKLVERGSRGVVLSEAGRLLAPALEAIVTQLETARAASPEGAEITLGAPSYLQTSLLPVLGAASPSVRIRAFELPPSLLRANAQDDGFDILLAGRTAGSSPSTTTFRSRRPADVRLQRRSRVGAPPRGVCERYARLDARRERHARAPLIYGGTWVIQSSSSFCPATSSRRVTSGGIWSFEFGSTPSATRRPLRIEVRLFDGEPPAMRR